MSLKRIATKSSRCVRFALTSIALLQFSVLGPLAISLRADDSSDGKTATPIKHVIVIIGENRTFDHLFATYIPKKGETINNLLSEGIVNEDGTPGPHYRHAHQ